MSKKNIPRDIDISGNQSLMERMQQGHLDARNELLKKYIPYLSTKYLPTQIPALSQDEANDIASTAALRASNKCKQCRNESDLKVHNWITRISTNLAFSFLRKKNSRKELPLDESYDDYLPGDVFDEKNILDLLSLERIVPRAGLTRLEVLILSNWLREEFSGIEMADKLGISAARVSQIKSEALDKLSSAANSLSY